MEIDLTQSARQAGGTEPIKEGSTATFMTDVIEASAQHPVVVDFWAPWCGPCRQLTPVLEKLVRAAGGAVSLVKINIDDNPQIAQQLRIQSIPAVIAFQGGQPVDGFMGAQPESQVRAFIERLKASAGPAASPVDDALALADEALARGDAATAAQAYGQVLQAAPDRLEAVAGLARAYLQLNDIEHARQVLDSAPEGASSPELDSARAALELAGGGAGAGDLAALQAAVDAHPEDHQARFDLAVSLAARGEAEAAVDHLLHIVAADRAWNDEAARKQLLKIFEAYGPTHEVTQNGRRRLSALLFS